MNTPPFKHAPTTRIAALMTESARMGPAPLADACCSPLQGDADRSSRRAKLAELNPHLHCSVIGTCFSTAELRKLVPRYCDLDRGRASDLDIHHAGVQLAGEGGPAAKAIHKALDDRYESAIKRFQRLKTADELRNCWNACLKSGEVPGAYWALMTHPLVTPELRQLAFGEVHMLSHLVGAANRADIRRLVALQQENDALNARVENQQLRLQQVTAEREALSAALAEQALRKPIEGVPDQWQALQARLDALEAELKARDQLLAHQTHRREIAETQARKDQALLQELLDQRENSVALIHSLNAELCAVEATLSDRLQASSTQAGFADVLHGKRVVYVGGRPTSNRVIKALVESAGGEFHLHDGGIEDRKGLLAAALPRADMVVFPVDCIDHDSMSTLKRVCEKHRIPFHPLRTASAASFSVLLERLDASMQAKERSRPPLSRFCLKHG